MITNVLLDHAALVPLALIAVVAGCVVVGLLVLRRGHSARSVLAGLLVASLLPVLGLTLVPAARPRLDEQFCTVQFTVPSLGSLELLANVALFVPAASSAVLLSRRPLLVFATATAASAAIETLQGLVAALDRACDTDDWAMNTAGAAIGVLLALATLAAGQHPDPAHHP